jgi:hypothetical protein
MMKELVERPANAIFDVRGDAGAVSVSFRLHARQNRLGAVRP